MSFAGTAYWFDQNANRHQFYDRLLDLLVADPSAASNNLFHDVASLNVYRTADDVLRVSRVLKAIQRAHGIDKPLWLTETNAMPTDDRSIAPCDHGGDLIKTTMEQQAAFGIQAFAMAAVAGFQRVGFYAMTDEGPCNQPAVWGAVRDDGSRRPVADALRTIIRGITGYTRARFAPLLRSEARWGVWPEDPLSYWPNWGIYLMAFDLPGARRVSVVWNADPMPTCARFARNGNAAHVLDKHGTASPASLQGDTWTVTLAPATAHFADDPDGYYFIGGDPLLLVEEGVNPSAPVVAPQAC